MSLNEPWAFDGPPTDYERSYVPLNRAPGCAVVLGLDCSSTMIGWVVWDGSARDHGEIKLPGDDIALRCKRAFAAIGLVIQAHPDIDCVAIESPVIRFAGCIPQIRISGVVMLRAALYGLHTIEVTPAAAKKSLAGMGNASKGEMRAAAMVYGVTGEHASDALGIALVASKTVSVVV